jgi:hypothetical protein
MACSMVRMRVSTEVAQLLRDGVERSLVDPFHSARFAV